MDIFIYYALLKELGNEEIIFLWSSARAARAYNHRAISPAALRTVWCDETLSAATGVQNKVLKRGTGSFLRLSASPVSPEAHRVTCRSPLWRVRYLFKILERTALGQYNWNDGAGRMFSQSIQKPRSPDLKEFFSLVGLRRVCVSLQL